MTKRQRLKGKGISLLVPFVTTDPRRQRTWDWLEKYWAHELPLADVHVGVNYEIPFSKTSAVNDAANHARGDIFVIMDADCYIRGGILVDCAERIRLERSRGHKLWFMPYRRFYRLTDTASRAVLDSDPADPLRYPDPAANSDVENNPLSGIKQGHWFGALVQMMPREAFEQLDGMDPRFSGWGGEDVAFMRALDTLYARHMTVPTGVFHLWHQNKGATWSQRTWSVGERVGNNNKLFSKYYGAIGDTVRMRRLVQEGHDPMLVKHESTETTKKITIYHQDLLDALLVKVPPGGSTKMARHEGVLTVIVLAADKTVVSTTEFTKAQLMNLLHITAEENSDVTIRLETDKDSLLITVHSVQLANFSH